MLKIYYKIMILIFVLSIITHSNNAVPRLIFDGWYTVSREVHGFASFVARDDVPACLQSTNP